LTQTARSSLAQAISAKRSSPTTSPFGRWRAPAARYRGGRLLMALW